MYRLQSHACQHSSNGGILQSEQSRLSLCWSANPLIMRYTAVLVRPYSFLHVERRSASAKR